jgi:hypothetical protein
MPNKVDFLKAKVQALKSVLEKTSAKEREARVSTHMAKQFNELLKEIGEAVPDAAAHLPKPIPSTTEFRHMGISDVGYVDLMIMAEQVIGVLSVVASHG